MFKLTIKHGGREISIEMPVDQRWLSEQTKSAIEILHAAVEDMIKLNKE